MLRVKNTVAQVAGELAVKNKSVVETGIVAAFKGLAKRYKANGLHVKPDKSDKEGPWDQVAIIMKFGDEEHVKRAFYDLRDWLGKKDIVGEEKT